MLKRKLKTPIEHVVQSKKRAVETRLDGIFVGVEKPDNVEETLNYIRSLVEWRKFCGKIPPVVLKGQIYSLYPDRTKTDADIEHLRKNGKVVITKLDSQTYGIVEREEYLNILKNQVSEDSDLEDDTANHFTRFVSQDNVNIEISKSQLTEFLKDTEIDQLVRAGFLTFEVTGMFYLTIPNASLFLRTFADGLKHVRYLIRKSKFKEILMNDLLSKSSKKTSRLGIMYYCLYLIGSDNVKVISTSIGPILRYNDDD